MVGGLFFLDVLVQFTHPSQLLSGSIEQVPILSRLPCPLSLDLADSIDNRIESQHG